MFKLSFVGFFILYFNLFDSMYAAPDIQELDNSSTTEKIKSLHKIQPSEVLPIIGIFYEKYDLSIPNDLEKIIMVDGRIAFGTQFTLTNPTNPTNPPQKDQIFLCPIENSNKKCLVAKSFQNLEPLQCSTEAVPIIEVDTKRRSCGPKGDEGIPYKVTYKFCEGQKLFKTKEAPLYGFCYHHKKRRIIFSSHFIMSPKLLNSKLLFREQEVSYEMINDDKIVPSNYMALKNALENEAQLVPSPPAFPNEAVSESPSGQKKFPYKVQKLVPAEDMAFALWRKSTFYFINADLQHEKLITLWNKIGDYVASASANMLIKEGKLPYIYNGVFDIPQKSISALGGSQNQIYNIWIKMVLHGKTYQAVAILMNNFIDNIDKSDIPDSPSPMETAIENLCGTGKDLCVPSLKEEFTKIGGGVRCCVVTKNIEELFGMEEGLEEVKLLPIKNITFE